MENTISVNLKIWRQRGPKEKGQFVTYHLDNVSTDSSFLEALDEIADVRKEFYTDLRIVGNADDLNTELEKALRLEDFLVIAKMMAIDALNRNESCGAHFREEYQTADGEAKRNDEDYMYVSCWKYTGDDAKPILIKEPLKYEAIEVKTRNYKS